MKTILNTTILVGLFVGLGDSGARAQLMRVGVAPIEDTFVRQQLPDATFGAADVLHVSGANARNGLGTIQGVQETWMMFDLSNAVADFDARFGAGDWEIESVVFDVTEVQQPESNLLARGAGSFNINWVSADGWTEGTGQPNDIATVSGNDLSFNAAQVRLADAQMQNLGRFMNTAMDDSVAVELVLRDMFLSEVESGDVVTLYLTPADEEIGFTFRSKEWGETNPDDRPLLTVTARGTAVGPTDPGNNGNQNSGGGGQMVDEPDPGEVSPPPAAPVCGMAMAFPMALMLTGLALVRVIRSGSS